MKISQRDLVGYDEMQWIFRSWGAAESSNIDALLAREYIGPNLRIEKNIKQYVLIDDNGAAISLIVMDKLGK